MENTSFLQLIMDQKLADLLYNWPMDVIHDYDIATLYHQLNTKRYGIVNRALKAGTLNRLKRGVYLIGKPFKRALPSPFSIAHHLNGPSYISYQSALSHHMWIPEGVFSTTLATSKRSQNIQTEFGNFLFYHVPPDYMYLGVENENSFLIASPWKAIADYDYTFKRGWKNIHDLHLDLRIEMEEMQKSDLAILKKLSENYQSLRVRHLLKTFFQELSHGNPTDRRKN
jgi:hypothetical protein